MSWETYFMSVAHLSSFRSKDQKTQNGACIVDIDKRIIGIGYNGLPKGCSDDNPEYWLDDDNLSVSKHTYVVHAEKNAIYNSMGRKLQGSTMYTTQLPCNICAQAIIQVGISRVIYSRKKEHHKEINKAVRNMFENAEVVLIPFDTLSSEDTDYIEKMHRSFDEVYNNLQSHQRCVS